MTDIKRAREREKSTKKSKEVADLKLIEGNEANPEKKQQQQHKSVCRCKPMDILIFPSFNESMRWEKR